MSSVMPISHHTDPIVSDLRAQVRGLSVAAPRTLVVRAPGTDAALLDVCERVLSAPLHLESADLDVEDASVRHAIGYAARELGVAEVIVILQSDAVEPSNPQNDAESLDFMARVVAARQQKEAGHEAARAKVRACVQTLAGDSALAGVSVAGLVQIAESGVLLSYDAEQDTFEAML